MKTNDRDEHTEAYSNQPDYENSTHSLVFQWHHFSHKSKSNRGNDEPDKINALFLVKMGQEKAKRYEDGPQQIYDCTSISELIMPVYFFLHDTLIVLLLLAIETK